ncbi:MAG: histidine kinase [Turicibacter sp.]|nr:histidine kinase [Turicibacter sp.]
MPKPKIRFFSILMALSFVMVISVSLVITTTVIHMSERFYLSTYSVQNERVLNQIRRNLESFHQSVSLTMLDLQESTVIENILSSRETIANSGLMVELLDLQRRVELIQTNLLPSPVSLTVVGKDNEFIFVANSQIWTNTKYQIREKGFDEHTRKIQYRWDFAGEGDIPFVIITQSLVNFRSDNHYGTALLAISNEEFSQFYNSHIGRGNHVFLLSENGYVVSSDVEASIGTFQEELASLIEGFPVGEVYELEIEGIPQLIMMEPLPNMNLYLFNVVEEHLILDGIFNKGEIFYIVLGITMLFGAIMFVITKRTTKSLSHLATEISEASHSKFKQAVEVSGPLETREIAEAFNHTLEELQRYTADLMTIQRKKHEAELTSLQRQINIHFLYNTLAAIKILVREGDKEEAVETINDLVSLLQFTVGDTNESAFLHQEVECLNSYVKIHGRRYGNRVAVNFFVEEETKFFKIPKLLIQPFIENAFVHAFSQGMNGDINVFIYLESGMLRIEIVDNGKGFDPESGLRKIKDQKQAPHPKQTYFSGVGIQNIKERLQLLYENRFKLEVSSRIGEGTTVIIELPIDNQGHA